MTQHLDYKWAINKQYYTY